MAQTHEIHTSEIRSFQGCRRRWNWSYREGIVPQQSAKPLQFGIAFHIAMEVFYDPETWLDTTPEEKTKRAVEAFIASSEEQRAKFLKESGQTTLLEAEGDDYTERIDLGIGMLEWYGSQIHPKEDTWFKPVMVEVPFQVPICNPATGEPLRCYAPPVEQNPTCPSCKKSLTWVDDQWICSKCGDEFAYEDEFLRTCGQVHGYGAEVTYDGRIDAIMQDLHNGGYFIWDHKSAAQIRKNDRLLHLDPQVNGYTWAAYSELGIDVRGFLYVEYRKDYPRPPKMLSRPYKGRHFSTDKTSPTDVLNFTQTVQKYHPQGLQDGLYDEYIEWLQGPEAPVFHKRFPIIKTKRNLKNVGETLYLIAKDMVAPDLLIYPNAGHFSCSGCIYYDPCLAKTLGEDYAHALRSDPFVKVK